jgi:Tfp pilus assembly protein PilE
MINTKKCKDSGFTLIELLVVFDIVSFAIIALFVGIQFAENQIFKNYHYRKAMLLASARLEYHYFYWKKTGDFQDLTPDAVPVYGGEYLLDEPSYNKKVYISFNTKVIKNYDYQSLGNTYMKTTIGTTGTWREPSRSNKEQKIYMEEVYYDRIQ